MFKLETFLNNNNNKKTHFSVLTGHVSAAGLCDINEGSATSEDRCKSPTSGNMFFNVVCSLLRDKDSKKVFNIGF